jgi:hypothetical protein
VDIGGISMQFTAAAILKFEEDRKLSGAVLEQRGAMVQGMLDRPLLAQPGKE